MITAGLFLVAVAIDYMYSAWCGSSGHLPGNQEAINTNLMKLPILTMLQVRLFGPISEELVFRGVFMNLFFQKETKRNKFYRVFFAGAFFGLGHELHLSVALLVYCSLDWGLSYCYYECDGLIYPIALHLLLNNLSS